jgi:hypothetical protein
LEQGNVLKYATKAEYILAIQELHRRARRSGWKLGTVHRNQIASWLGVSTSVLVAHNLAYDISVADIQSGQV